MLTSSGVQTLYIVISYTKTGSGATKKIKEEGKVRRTEGAREERDGRGRDGRGVGREGREKKGQRDGDQRDGEGEWLPPAASLMFLVGKSGGAAQGRGRLPL